MYNTVNQGPLSNSIALHYFDEKTVDPKGCFYFIEEWIQKNGLLPTKMGGKGDKSITFSRGKKTLEKTNFEGVQEQGIWIAALPPEEKIVTECFDFLMAGDLDYARGFKKNSCVLCWDDKLIPWDTSYIKDLVKDLHQFCNPKYGYAFQREFKKGPGFYPGGVISGLDHSDETKKERQEITNWGITGLADESDPDYQPHMIRDVYPLNFLSPQHLKAQIGDQALEQWIKSDSTRGSLEELLPNFWCWSVEAAHIESIKEALKPHNILIAHMDF